ncbi:MAG: HEPN domain-containing protein, partial [Rhizobiaceae bacterium]|nr:HEPN domain-containing protein [Rhizobiaceae bacterium]
MSREVTIASALRLARGCLADARLLAGSGSRNAAYLADQALEQLIRAFATSENIHIERADAHQLDKVIRAFPDAMGQKHALRRLSWLEAYATSFRYPSPAGRIPRSPDPQRLASA